MRVSIIGTGYVGLVSGMCFAEKGNEVICIDVNKEKIHMINNGIMPIHENGLKAMYDNNIKEERIEFTSDLEYAVRNTQVIFIAVGTPSLSNGCADLSQVETVAIDIARAMNEYKVIVNKSTVPIGTQKLVTKIIRENQLIKCDFDVVSNPEFLREGNAINDTLNGDRIVIGSDSEKALKIMKELYRNFNQQLVLTIPENAEMIKYACNAFLATKISFINEIANICEKAGADIDIVAKAMGMDNRIGDKFLCAGVGFGGACFPKDTKALIKMGQKFGSIPSIIEKVIEVNENQKLKPIEKLLYSIKNIKGKTFGILGLAFKPNTDDIREAPSIRIISEIQKHGGSIKAYDPIAMNNAKKIFEYIEYVENPYEAVKGVDAVILVTEWDEFKVMDLKKVMELMKGNTFIDGRNLFDYETMSKLGYEYYCIGRRDERYYNSNETFK